VPARYEMATSVKGAFAEVKTQVVDALKAQGFGVLTEIDVQKTLKEKLGADMEPYIILGACNPQLAHRALDADRSIGLLLPCNVVLRQEEGDVRVSILDPRALFEVVDTKRKPTSPISPRRCGGDCRPRWAALETVRRAGATALSSSSSWCARPSSSP
jgi:uncharacterized protein (DUF302 family)